MNAAIGRIAPCPIGAVCLPMIPFHNLRPLAERLAPQLQAASQRVLASGWYVLGPEVEAFEHAWANYLGVSHAVGVANGTDAIELALRAADIGPGDEVITVAHTAVATVCGIERAGARPVLVDIDAATYTMDPAAAAAAITPRTRAILPVHLYGQPADMTALTALADRHDLTLIEDCAQAHGARWRDRPVGTFGDLATFSFYPTKNLSAAGDAGAVVTNYAPTAQRLRQLRSYGQVNRDSSARRGVNSRLDELQAAILLAKLPYLDQHNSERRELAAEYDALLRDAVSTPHVAADARHVYHLYVVRSPERDRLRDELARQGIGTLVHYPLPAHLQPAYADLGYESGSLPVTELAAREILSLPLYIGLSPGQLETVATAVRSTLAEALP
ncbi:MAG: DegT/DnrJ/EryC1/StrS family aminotransferase [Pirellulales bacterium]|nr:DegT/DnrJ/EryC1/StrS family aminotransferase [Pirellulales bacterium]